MNRIGLLGGISYESTIKYYDLLLVKYFKKFQNYYYPEIVIFSLDFQKLTDLEHIYDKEKYIEYLLSGIRSLENAGVNFITIAANSPHAVFEDLEKKSKVPIISIVKTTAKEALKLNMKKILLLGIKFTMRSNFYQKYFLEKGIEVITPSIEEQNKIEKIIFNELVIGLFKKESKNELLQIIKNYENVDGVILGCTELPLILTQRDTDIKLLDTLEIHVDATLDFYFKL